MSELYASAHHTLVPSDVKPFSESRAKQLVDSLSAAPEGQEAGQEGPPTSCGRQQSATGAVRVRLRLGQEMGCDGPAVLDPRPEFEKTAASEEFLSQCHRQT